MEKIIIDSKNAAQRLDKFLKRYMPNAKAGFLYKMLREKKIKLNGKKVRGDVHLSDGDEITIFFANETLEKFKLESQSAKKKMVKKNAQDSFCFNERVIYENEDMLIFNKPAGLLSQKAKPDDVSVCELLIDYLYRKGELNDDVLRLYKPSVVNRLDRNTSGVLICAKSLAAARQLSDLFKDRELEKEYLALVYGSIIKGKRKLRSYLKKDEGDNKVVIYKKYKEGCEYIETIYEPIENNNGATLLNVRLITGKPHQIRAQLCAQGFPILGDTKYCTKESLRFNAEMTRPLRRQFLHSGRIAFPKCEGVLASLSNRAFTAPLPKELKEYLKELRFEAWRADEELYRGI